MGATRPTVADGSLAPGSFAAQAAVQFGPARPARIGLEGQVSLGGSTIGFTTTGGVANPGASELATGARFGFSGSVNASSAGADVAGCATSGCKVELRGGLFGPDASRLGLTYTVRGDSADRAIGGAAVFGKQ